MAGNNILQIRSEMIATAAPTSNSILLFTDKSTVIGHDDFTLTVKSYDSSLSPSLYVVLRFRCSIGAPIIPCTDRLQNSYLGQYLGEREGGHAHSSRNVTRDPLSGLVEIGIILITSPFLAKGLPT